MGDDDLSSEGWDISELPSETEILNMPDSEEVTALRRSLAGHKGHATRAGDAIKRLGPLVEQQASRRMQRELEEEFDKLKAQAGKCIEIYEDLINHAETDEAAENARQQQHCFVKNFEDARIYVLTRPQDAEGPPRQQQQQAPQQPPEGRGGARIQDGLKPEKLTLENTPAEQKAWTKRFRAYYSTSKMANLSKEDQQAYFFTCLDRQLEVRIRELVDLSLIHI